MEKDRENVVSGLQHCIGGRGCYDCPYTDCDSCTPFCKEQIMRDALELLKAQEPIPPVKDGEGCLICGNQTLGCGVVGHYDVETGEVTDKIDNYCAFCGRKVRW